jgi:hypothetical protein
MTSKTARIAETEASVCGLRRREGGEGVDMERFELWFDSRGFFLRDYTLKLKNRELICKVEICLMRISICFFTIQMRLFLFQNK